MSVEAVKIRILGAYLFTVFLQICLKLAYASLKIQEIRCPIIQEATPPFTTRVGEVSLFVFYWHVIELIVSSYDE